MTLQKHDSPTTRGRQLRTNLQLPVAKLAAEQMNKFLGSACFKRRVIWSERQQSKRPAFVPLLQNLHLTIESGMCESRIAILSADRTPLVRLKMPNAKHFKPKRKIHSSIRMDSTNLTAISTASPRQTGTGINRNLNRSEVERNDALSHGRLRVRNKKSAVQSDLRIVSPSG